MPSKDDCNRALNKLIECKQRRLCDKCNFKIRCTMSNDKFIIKKLIDEHFNPKPYKFEDLKPNMWVWDNVAKECLYVVRPFITTGVRVKYFTCLGIWNLEKIKKLNMKFEENRFFSVQCANYLGGI
ncbi:hypothetical protein [Thomasclavelia ramosa]|uniref:hypothetical protein n=1 Tax=Thomasclavelia ramosa TaxID=1547 RepID=UPI000E416821|nr:hypothetical protein [Thomasclavelia ramosa]RGC89237.1 hypothetical protein DW242_09900 [Thomasclavelia ramosa]